MDNLQDRVVQMQDLNETLANRQTEIVQSFNKKIIDYNHSMDDRQLKNDRKLESIHYMLETLPGEVKDCHRLCEDASKATTSMREIVQMLELSAIEVKNNKVDTEEYREFTDKAKDQLTFLTDHANSTLTQQSKLENWIDIYMPLKLQHQITESLKMCLKDKRQRYMLGIVDNLIQKHLRKKVFDDIGGDHLKEKCLKLIERLKLDAKILTQTEIVDVKQLEFDYDKWQFK